MTDHVSIQDSIRQASDELERSADGDIPLPVRRTIMSKLGPGLGSSSPPIPAVGYVKRVRLAIMAVEKSASIWEAALPDDDAARDALELARDVTTGAVSMKFASLARGSLWTHCDDLSY